MNFIISCLAIVIILALSNYNDLPDKKKLLFILAILLLLVASGCADDPLEEGRVIDRVFTPEHWEDGYRSEPYMDCGMHYNYTDGEYDFGCKPASRRVYEEHHEWVTNDWDVLIRHCEPDTDEGKKGKCRSQWKDVSEEHFALCKMGAMWKRDVACLPQ